ncbi:MAG: cell division protein FtsX [Hyphomicrobiales bacterium]
MATREERYQKRKVTGSYITSTISITLVLFLFGILGLMLVNAHKLSQHIKENLGFEISMKPTVKQAEILKFKKSMDAKPYIKSTEYISSSEALERLSKITGEDFNDIIDSKTDPIISPTIDIRFKANWANNDSIDVIKAKLMEENPVIKEVFYQKSLVHLVNNNLRRIGIVLLGFSILFMVIAFALVNNTIRLSVYSKRFTIRSMQLVGATRGFISRPFIFRGILQGFISSLFALGLLSILLFNILKHIPETKELQDIQLMAGLYLVVILLGIIMSGYSTRMAVRKYLNTKTDNLYY